MKRTLERTLADITAELHVAQQLVHKLTTERNAHPTWLAQRKDDDRVELERYLSPWIFDKLVTRAKPGTALLSLKTFFEPQQREWTISITFENRSFVKCVTIGANGRPQASSLAIPRDLAFATEEEMWATFYVENSRRDERDVAPETLAAIALAAWCTGHSGIASKANDPDTSISDIWERKQWKEAEGEEEEEDDDYMSQPLFQERKPLLDTQ